MSSRINELAVRAGGIWRGGYVEQPNGDSVYTDKKFVSGGDMDVEQFAKLVLRDMHPKVIASILITDVVMEEKGQVPTSEDYIRAIHKDFGVEE